MGKRPAKGNTGEVTKVEKFDYENYIRFGYRLPHGLVVTRVNAQIGGEDGIPLPVSFIDRAPVCMNGAINFDHLHDVLIFAVTEKVDRDLKRVLDEQAEGIPLGQYSSDAMIDSWLNGDPPCTKPIDGEDEECTCDQCFQESCENNFTVEEKVERDMKAQVKLAEMVKDCKADPFPFDADEVEPYLNSKGQMIYPDSCDHLNGYCRGEDNCTEPGFPGRAE